jgi:pyochelin biosynthetic protein PchC
MRTSANERWIRRFRDDDAYETKLICFPHAGGAASAFRSWPRGLPPDVGVLAIRYPGREDRLGDPFPSGLEALADDIADALGELTRHRLVLFGHSMGASVAHEVALRFQERGRPPAALCVSARQPPHALEGQRKFFGTDEELIADVISFDPTRAAVFEDPGLRDLVFPAVRADFGLVNYYLGGDRPLLDCPVYGYVGDQDEVVAVGKMHRWEDLTSVSFRLLVLPGRHFYLREDSSALLADLSGILDEVRLRDPQLRQLNDSGMRSGCRPGAAA